MNLQTLGGRRFLFSVACVVATVGLQWAGKLDPAGSTYALVVVAVVSAYIAGNTVQAVKGPAQPEGV